MVAFIGKDNGDGTTTFPNSEVRRMYAEIEELRRDVDRRQQQYERSQRYWVDAAQKALAGDTEHLRLRVDMALSGPITMTEGRPPSYEAGVTMPKDFR